MAGKDTDLPISINLFIAKHFTSTVIEQNNNSNEILQRSQEEAELMMGTGSQLIKTVCSKLYYSRVYRLTQSKLNKLQSFTNQSKQ